MLFVGLRCLVVATAATPQFTKTERTALDHLQLVTYIVYHKYINPKIKEIMSEEIRYQINGQLADNTVTVDNKEDRSSSPSPTACRRGTYHCRNESGRLRACREETIRHVFDLEKRVTKRLLMSGVSVNTGLYYASVSFHGVIESSAWNPAKNSIVVNFNVGADLREAIKNTVVNIIGAKGSAMYIAGVQDTSTRALDSSATAGRAFTLKGAMLKVTGTDDSVGITLTDSKGTITEITEDLWVLNEPSRLSFIIPAGLDKGTYELKVTTQYSRNTLLKVPRSVIKTIYIGTAPTGGGSGGDGGIEEDPLG